jgi:transposase-like protein
MPKIVKERVSCPVCHSATYAWGHSARYPRRQRYRCKNPDCRRQFIAGIAIRHLKRYPKLPCPRCGGRMTIFRILSDGYRLRCNNHIHKDHRHCHHKVNVPLPGKSFKIAKDSADCIQTNLAVRFSWSKMRFEKSCVSLVAYFAVFQSIPATQVSKIMRDMYNFDISHDTVTRWTHKAALNVHRNLGPLSVPKVPGRRRTLTDETVFWVRGQKRWLWMTKDSRFDAEQSWLLSPKRSTEYARSTFNIAFTTSPALKNVTALTDGLHSYASALGDLGFNPKKHHVYKGFFESPNNNRRERTWSTIKVNARRFRGFKSDLGLWAFATHHVYLHNYFKPNNRLDAQTPAEAVGVKLPRCQSYWKLFMTFL